MTEFLGRVQPHEFDARNDKDKDVCRSPLVWID